MSTLLVSTEEKSENRPAVVDMTQLVVWDGIQRVLRPDSNSVELQIKRIE